MGKKEKQADRFVDNVNGCDLSVVLLALVGSGISLDISHSFPYLSILSRYAGIILLCSSSIYLLHRFEAIF
jgi:hypothetical protein